MDLTLQNESGEDVMILSPSSLDMAWEVSDDKPELDFLLTMDRAVTEMRAGCMVYAEGTDWGGMLRKYNSDGHKWTGDTWAGLLASRVLVPDGGSGSLSVSGTAQQVIAEVVRRCGLDSVFSVELNGLVDVGSWTFPKYIDAWTGLCRMLRDRGARLAITHNGVKPVLQAVPATDWTLDEAFDSSLVNVSVQRDYACVNHLVGRGEGQDGARVAVDLYLDANGNVSKTQTIKGRWERAEYYNYSNADADKLTEDGTKRLKEYYAAAQSVKVKLLDGEDRYSIGDKVGGEDQDTGEYASAYISKKIVKVDSSGRATVEYGTGGL